MADRVKHLAGKVNIYNNHFVRLTTSKLTVRKQNDKTNKPNIGSLTMSDSNIENKLCEEVSFWDKYIKRNQGLQEQLKPRMYQALNFAQQRLTAYRENQSRDVEQKN